MFTKINKAMKERDLGFTLIELLVVIIIIGILAGIAIPVFFSQRAKASDAAVKSDLANAATSFESYYSTNNAYPTTNAAIQSSADAIKVTTGNTIKVVTDGSTSYCLLGWSINGQSPIYTSANPMLYDSSKGGMQAPSTLCSLSGTLSTFSLP